MVLPLFRLLAGFFAVVVASNPCSVVHQIVFSLSSTLPFAIGQVQVILYVLMQIRYSI